MLRQAQHEGLILSLSKDEAGSGESAIGATAGGNAPESWIGSHAALVPFGGTVIDVACGSGWHGRLFLARGHPVTFVDRDVTGVADLAGRSDARIVAADLERDGWPFGSERFAAVVVVNYLWRPLLPTLVDAVAPGGALLYQTFAQGNERFGRPSNPDYLLAPGELLDAVRGQLEVVAYQHGEGLIARPAVVQRIAAVRGATRP